MSRRKPRGKQQNSSSLVIPVVVGVVVLAVVVGAIILIEAQPSRTSGVPGDVLAAANTALPLSTQSIPHPNVPRISLDETRDKLASGQAVLVDVRSKDSYDRTHATGAFSIPEVEIESRLHELPREKEIVLYCT